MEIQQSMRRTLPCNTLLPHLCLLITVTFSTPTGDFTQNSAIRRIEPKLMVAQRRPGCRNPMPRGSGGRPYGEEED